MQCGTSIEFYDLDIETFKMKRRSKLGFKVLDHKLQIYGLCHDCNVQK
jgi:Fe2+ or Zn2+ uptake regulation protein